VEGVPPSSHFTPHSFVILSAVQSASHKPATCNASTDRQRGEIPFAWWQTYQQRTRTTIADRSTTVHIPFTHNTLYLWLTENWTIKRQQRSSRRLWSVIPVALTSFLHSTKQCLHFTVGIHRHASPTTIPRVYLTGASVSQCQPESVPGQLNLRPKVATDNNQFCQLRDSLVYHMFDL
jgi:hypothetical protein